MKISLESAVQFLKSHDKFLILMHASPDGDTLGAGIALFRALKEISKQAVLGCSDEIPSRYDYLFEGLTSPFTSDFDPETVICVDIADAKLLGKKMSVYKDSVALCIDHHMSNTLFAAETYLDVKASATCEMMGYIIEGLGVEMDKHMANAVFTGLSTDTGCFRYNNVTAKTHYMAGRTIEAGAEAGTINKVMFETKSRTRIEIEKEVLQNISFYFEDKCALILITADMYKLVEGDESELEGITSLPRQIEGVQVGVTIKEQNGRYKISMRTHPPYDASEICKMLGGGGHACAAGCELRGEIDEVKAKIIAAVGEYLNK